MILKKRTLYKRRILTGDPVKAVKPVKSPWFWLLVLASLFSLMWIFGMQYQTAWHWYFGVDSAELEIPVRLYLEQGFSFLITSLTVFLFICIVTFILRVIVLLLWKVIRRKEYLPIIHIFSFHVFFTRMFHVLPVAFWVFIEFLMHEVAIHNERPDFYNASQFEFNMFRFIAFLFAVFLTFQIVGDLLPRIPKISRKKFQPPDPNRKPNSPIRLILEAALITVTSLVYINMLGMTDAAVSYRHNGAYDSVKCVTVESDYPLNGIKYLRLGGDLYTYRYGPLGLIGENRYKYLLIHWKSDGETTFPIQPGVIWLEKSADRPIRIYPCEAEKCE